MTTPDAGDDSGLFELAPEAPARSPARWVPPQQARESAKPLPCPKCRYDLRGLRGDICPECGLKLNYSARRQAEDLRAGRPAHPWLDRKAIAMALVGLVVSAAVMWFEGGAIGLMVFGLDFAFTIAAGWSMFFLCSVMWIGFDQPLRATVVQTIGAFGFYAGAAAVIGLLPIPGLVIWLIGMAVLAGVLSDLLEIDLQDAAIIAVLVTVLRIAFWAAVLLSMMG